MIRLLIRKSNVFVCFCLVVHASCFAQQVASDPLSEYEIKAGYIYRFLSFVDWPVAAFEKMDQPFTIGVLGSDSLADYLQPLVGTLIDGRPIAIRQIRDVSVGREITECQVLFISAESAESIEGIFKTLKQVPVLTVGEQGGFLEKGGMINFVTYRNKVKFEINDAAVSRSGLTIRSMMKRLAVRIIGGRKASE